MNEYDDAPYDPGQTYTDYGENQPGQGGAGTSLTTPGYTETPSSTTDTTGGFDFNKLLSSIFGSGGVGSKLGSALSTPAGLITALAAIQALRDRNQPVSTGYKGPGVNMGLTATRNVMQPAARTSYGAPAMGQQYFSPVQYAAQGGIMGLAQGRYLKGSTDGMADEIPSSIDGEQPAKLSHGEFVVPADVVSHLGNGNSDAGANVLYKMMDRVRKARTGTAKQGKEINPTKFTPGGSTDYAGGGAVAFVKGGDIKGFDGTTGSQVGSDAKFNATAVPVSISSNLSEWAGPYVTDMLSRANALTNMAYQPYQGQLTAGTSPLQQQAYGGISSLAGGSPWQYDLASQYAAQAGRRAGQLNYRPQDISVGQVGAPSLTQYQMNAPTDVTGAQAQAASLQNAPQAQAAQTGYVPNLQTYQMGPAQQVGTQTFTAPGTAESFMSPYMQNVVDIQQREAQRQADIAATSRGAQAAKAGAFGGARQAIESAEAARNLARQKGDIQAQGLQSAYQQAQQQFNTQQQQALQAALANQQAGLTTGVQNLGAALGVQQLGTQTGLQAALANQQAQQQAALANQALAGQYGLAQAGYGQAANLQNAQMAQQAALANQQAGLTTGQQNLAARLGIQQLGAQQGLQAQQLNQAANLQAQQLAANQQQFGANLGLQGLQAQLGAAGQLGNLGQGQFGTQLSGLQALAGMGGTQQATEQAGLTALQNQYNQQMMWPYQQLQFQQSMLQGLPISTATSSAQTGALGNISNMLAGLGSIYKTAGSFGGP